MAVDIDISAEKGSITKRPNAQSIKSVHRGSDVEINEGHVSYDHTKRRLKPRHIQLIGIAGTIGTG